MQLPSMMFDSGRIEPRVAVRLDFLLIGNEDLNGFLPVDRKPFRSSLSLL